MFSFKKSHVVILSLVVVFIAAFFAGCSNNSAALSIDGKWTSSYGDGYEINGSFFSYNGVGNDWCIQGTIVETVFVTNDFGYIYYTREEDGKIKYFVTSFKDLTEKSIKLSDAYKKDGKTSEASLEAAKAEFTVENGYFSYYGEYIKQKN